MSQALPENVLNIISAAVTQAVEQTRAAVQPVAEPTPRRDYFRITENLLRNYPRLKRLLSDKEAYTKVELRDKSKSVVKYSPGYGRKDREDIVEDLEREREGQYNKTLRDFERLDKAIRIFEKRREFAVIRMYYFNEEQDGTPRPDDAPPLTWADVSFDLERDEKTCRRWRARMVNDIAVCLFVFEAAVMGGTAV